MKKLFQIFFYSVVSMKMQAGKTVVSMCDTMPGWSWSCHSGNNHGVVSVITAMLTVLVTFLMAGAGQEKQCWSMELKSNYVGSAVLGGVTTNISPQGWNENLENPPTTIFNPGETLQHMNLEETQNIYLNKRQKRSKPTRRRQNQVTREYDVPLQLERTIEIA